MRGFTTVAGFGRASAYAGALVLRLSAALNSEISHASPLPPIYDAVTVGSSVNENGYWRALTLTARRIHVPKYSARPAASIVSLSVSNFAHISAMPLLHLRHAH